MAVDSDETVPIALPLRQCLLVALSCQESSDSIAESVPRNDSNFRLHTVQHETARAECLHPPLLIRLRHVLKDFLLHLFEA